VRTDTNVSLGYAAEPVLQLFWLRIAQKLIIHFSAAASHPNDPNCASLIDYKSLKSGDFYMEKYLTFLRVDILEFDSTSFYSSHTIKPHKTENENKTCLVG
jgi:hypothetical protein